MDFTELLAWSTEEFKHLPWRKKRSLYKTLVSEIMLQQTTVGTVLNHFDRFIEAYPDFKSLAATSEDEICMAWKGLGYYRRARSLRLAAIQIASKNSVVPQSIEDLKKISGIGVYTASAITSIGRNKPALALDANLERVIGRLYVLKEEKGIKLQNKIQELFEAGFIFPHLEKTGPRLVNEALMDLGRVYCQANKTNCLLCPLSDNCQAYQLNSVEDYPVIKEKKRESFDLDVVRFVVKKGHKVLAYKKSKKEWLTGQVELPTFVIKTNDPKLKQYPKLKNKILKGNLLKFKTTITKYKITNYICELNLEEFNDLVGEEGKFEFIKNNIATENFSTATLKTFSRMK